MDGKYWRTKQAITTVIKYATGLDRKDIADDELNRGPKDTPTSEENVVATYKTIEHKDVGTLNLIVKIWIKDQSKVTLSQQPEIIRDMLVRVLHKKHLYTEYDEFGYGDSQPITTKVCNFLEMEDRVHFGQIGWKLWKIHFLIYPTLPT